MSDYSSFDEQIITYHKLASMYHWSWAEFEATPYMVIKELLKLIRGFRAG